MSGPGIGLLAVHAHPDDEAITTGGVLARAARSGRGAAVVTCTGGEHGEIVGEGMDAERLRPRLADVRRDELAASLDILGAGPPRLLGYRDSGMDGEPTNDDPRAFWQADLDEATGRLVAHIRELRPQVLVTYDAFGIYGHPDHVQAHRLTLLAAEAAAAPLVHPDAGPAWRVEAVFLATLPRTAIATMNGVLAERGLPSPFGSEVDAAAIRHGVDDGQITHRIDVRAHLDDKLDALRAHATQIGPDSLFLNFPDEVAEVVFGLEFFCRLGAPPRRGGLLPADDLLTGA